MDAYQTAKNISLLESFLEEIIWPFNKSILFSLIIPEFATIAAALVSDGFEDRFFRLLPLSYKNMFLISLLIFFSTIKVKPLKESLNC